MSLNPDSSRPQQHFHVQPVVPSTGGGGAIPSAGGGVVYRDGRGTDGQQQPRGPQHPSIISQPAFQQNINHVHHVHSGALTSGHQPQQHGVGVRGGGLQQAKPVASEVRAAAGQHHGLPPAQVIRMGNGQTSGIPQDHAGGKHHVVQTINMGMGVPPQGQGGGFDKGGFHGRGSTTWDHRSFAAKMRDKGLGWKEKKDLRAAVAKNNRYGVLPQYPGFYQFHRNNISSPERGQLASPSIPVTVRINFESLKQRWDVIRAAQGVVRARKARIVFRNATTEEACRIYCKSSPSSASSSGRGSSSSPASLRVAALNFANGFHPGGGYLKGAKAQEEDLCRQFPAYFSSLSEASKTSGPAIYPFGPGVQNRSGECTAYSDLVFTPEVVCQRSGELDGYRILEPSEQYAPAFIGAAAPAVRYGEKWDTDRLRDAITNIVVAPQYYYVVEEQEKTQRPFDVLVLGAWGCGAFGCDPEKVCSLFIEILQRYGGGDFLHLYDEICFAVPNFTGGGKPGEVDRNYLTYYNMLAEAFKDDGIRMIE